MSTKINVEGRRLVKENKIAEIGQGGGGSYTAGDGIDINARNVISVDNTVALKSDLPNEVTGTSNEFYWTSITIGDTTKEIPEHSGGTKIPTYGLTDDMLPENASNYAAYTIEELISFGLPLFAPKAVQDLGDSYPYAANIIPLVKNPYSGDVTEINLKGYFGVIINDATNNYPIIIGATHNYSTTYTGNAFATLRVYRSADNDYRIRNARYRRRQSINWQGTSGIFMHTVIAAADGCDVKIDNSSTVTYNDQIVPYTTATTALIIKNPQPDVKYYQQVGTPTTAGKYKLTVTVDANGYPTFEWVAES